MDNTKCRCGKIKKTWFKLCFDCSEKEKLMSNNFVQKKEEDFKSKYEGNAKYFFNSQMVRSKSELLICYFLTNNNIQFQYEPTMTLNHGVIKPDFLLYDDKGNNVILEHFGMNTPEYIVKTNRKIEDYKLFCKENPNFTFICTNEEDMYNLKDRLGKKLNMTPLKRALWK